MQSNQNAIKAGSATREASSVDRIRELADSLGFVPDIDVLLLTGWSPVTLEQYRKRGDGPPYGERLAVPS